RRVHRGQREIRHERRNSHDLRWFCRYHHRPSIDLLFIGWYDHRRFRKWFAYFDQTPSRKVKRPINCYGRIEPWLLRGGSIQTAGWSQMTRYAEAPGRRTE